MKYHIQYRGLKGLRIASFEYIFDRDDFIKILNEKYEDVTFEAVDQ